MTSALPAVETAGRTAVESGPEYMHIVSWWGWLFADVLFRRWLVPVALCGADLDQDPDLPEVGPGAPYCPECLARNTPGPIDFVPGYWR